MVGYRLEISSGEYYLTKLHARHLDIFTALFMQFGLVRFLFYLRHYLFLVNTTMASLVLELMELIIYVTSLPQYHVGYQDALGLLLDLEH